MTTQPTAAESLRRLADMIEKKTEVLSFSAEQQLGEPLSVGLDGRASALTWMAKKVDVLTLAMVSRHKDLRILMNTYYRATAAEIAQKL